MSATKHIIAIAQERGSNSKTRAGAWKYVLSHLPARKQRQSGRWNWDAWTRRQTERRADGRARVLGYSTGQSREYTEYSQAYNDDQIWEVRCAQRLARNDYGVIYVAPCPKQARPTIPAEYDQAISMIREAQHVDIIDCAMDSISFDHKRRADGTALHYELYDFAPGAALVCARRTEGTRYGVKTLSKIYLLIERSGEAIASREIKIPIAKYAKNNLAYGAIIAVARGEAKIPLRDTRHEIHRGYKLLSLSEDGSLLSVWDRSPWTLGEERIEQARDEHQGGLYYYASIDEAIEAASRNEVFGEARDHHRLVVCSVRATGCHKSYGRKLAATRLTPTEIIASTL